MSPVVTLQNPETLDAYPLLELEVNSQGVFYAYDDMDMQLESWPDSDESSRRLTQDMINELVEAYRLSLADKSQAGLFH
jgi:hypothetical protein